MWWKWKKKVGYDVLKYWNERENPNSNDPNQRNTKNHIEFVKANTRKEDKILDFGPGVGRILPAYNTNNEIIGYDISSNYKDRLIKAAKTLNLNFKLIVKEEKVTKFSFSEHYFDSSVSISVLLHQPPKQIENIMRELARVSKKVVIISHYDTSIPYDSIDDNYDKSKYCFNHDYKKLCKVNDFKILTWKHNDRTKQIYFVYSK